MRRKTNWRAVTKAIRAIKSCSTLEQLVTARRYATKVVNNCVSNTSDREVSSKFSLETDVQFTIIKKRMESEIPPPPALKGNEEHVTPEAE